MSRLGDDSATRTAKVLSLPTRAAILSMLLRSGPKTVKEIAESFQIHPNVARAHLDLMAEAGFLMTETRRRDKGRPAKIYFTWEGEASSLSEAGVDVDERASAVISIDEIEVEVRLLQRMLADASKQLTRIHELVNERKQRNLKAGEEQ